MLGFANLNPIFGNFDENDYELAIEEKALSRCHQHPQ